MIITITASIVTYHNNLDELKMAIDSFLNTNIDVRLYISDNSSDKKIASLCRDDRITYIYNSGNLGFGKGHNIAVKEAIKDGSEYHLILNPDVYFNNGVIEGLNSFMEKDSDIAVVMPKVIYPNGDIQRLCKLYPTPINLIFRRFIPFKGIKEKMDYKYEMKFFDYNSIKEVPILSGCFMFVDIKKFEKIGMFDENIFMYMEDFDLCRRFRNAGYKLIYYPEVSITHKFEKGSFKNRKLLKYHIKSAIYYFNKWGWMFDNKRRIVNKKAVNNIL